MLYLNFSAWKYSLRGIRKWQYHGDRCIFCTWIVTGHKK